MATQRKKAFQPRALKAGLAAEYLGISVRCLGDYADAGFIPRIRAGSRTHLYDIVDLDTFLDERKVGGAA